MNNGACVVSAPDFPAVARRVIVLCCRQLIRVMLIAGMGIAGIGLAQADTGNGSGHATRAAPGPERVALEFYSWYLARLAANQDPLADQPALMAKYVAKALLKEIKKKMESADGLNADYFIQAQDYSDGWLGAVFVSNLQINGNSATAQLVLGRLEPDVYRLSLKMLLEQGTWKILAVARRAR